MPKYKFSYGGKNYSVMANNANEAAPMIDDVVRHLGGSAEATQQPEQEKGILDRASAGLASSIPGMNTYEAIKGGGSGSDIAASVGADVGQAGILGGAALTGGLPMLAKAAGANAVLGAATGALEPVIKGAGDIGRAAGEKSLPGLLLNKAIPENTTNIPLGMLRQAPGAIGETIGELAPSAAMMFLGGKLAKNAAKPSPKMAPEIEARASFGAKEGIPLTQGELQGSQSPAMMKEAALRRSSGGVGPAQEMAQNQQTAIREALAKRAARLGDDTLGAEIRSGQFTEGRQLADVPEAAKALRSERGAAVGAAKEALAQEIPIRSNFAKELQGEIDSVLAKVKGAGRGSNRAKVADLLESYKEQAKDVKTMGGAINFLDDFDSAIKGTFDREAPNVSKVYLANVRNKIVAAMDEAGSKLAPEQQSNLKTAKAGFAEIADPAQDLKMLEENNPASLLRSITSGNKSLSKVQGFNKVFGEGTPQRQGLQSAVLQDLVKRSTMKEGISGNSLMKNLSKYDEATLRETFADKPELLKDLRDFSKKLADIENQRSPLGVVTSGNSITEAAIRLGKRLALDKATMGLGPMLMDAVDKMKAKKVFAPATPQAPKRGPIPYMPWMQRLSPGAPALAGAATLGTAQATK